MPLTGADVLPTARRPHVDQNNGVSGREFGYSRLEQPLNARYQKLHDDRRQRDVSAARFRGGSLLDQLKRVAIRIVA